MELPTTLPTINDIDPKPITKPKKGIRPQSAKNKGRTLQQWSASELKKALPHLQGNDIRSLSMGAAGDDLILSPLALQTLPYNFEMKNVENFQIWATIKQTLERFKKQDMNVPTLPCIVAKKNHVKPLVILPMGHWLHLLHVYLYKTKTPDAILTKIPEMCSLTDIINLFQLSTQENASLEKVFTLGLNTIKNDVTIIKSKDCLKCTNIQGMENITILEKTRFNFWDVWNKFKNRVLVFNRKDNIHTIYIAFPFPLFIEFIKAKQAVYF